MALKDIFKMTKANRYTQDGREELIKAQVAETEDRRYKIGEISEKTGLQKTANGWVKPKTGKAPGAKTGEGKTPAERNLGTKRVSRGPESIVTPGKGNIGMEEMKEAAEKGLTGQALKEFMQSKKNESKPSNTDWETKGKYQYKKFENENELNNFLKENGYQYQKEFGTSFSEKGAIHETVYKKGNETIVKSTGPGIKKPSIRRKSESSAASKPSAPKAPKPSVQEYMKAKDRVKKYEEQYKKEMNDYEYMERIKANGVDPSIFNPMYGGKPKPLSENKSYMEEVEKIKAYEANDAAPRVLTGDTKIRVRGTKDGYTVESINKPRESLEALKK